LQRIKADNAAEKKRLEAYFSDELGDTNGVLDHSHTNGATAVLENATA
jgi:hypothetical protein